MDDSDDNQHVRGPGYWASSPTEQSDTRGLFPGLHSLAGPWEERSTDSQAVQHGSVAESDVELEGSRSPSSRADTTASYFRQYRSIYGPWTPFTDHSVYGESGPPSRLAAIEYELERLTRLSFPPDIHPQAVMTLSLRPGEPRPQSPTSAIGSRQDILSTPPTQRLPATSEKPFVPAADDSQPSGGHTQIGTSPRAVDPTGVDEVAILRLPKMLHDERHLAGPPTPNAIGVVVGRYRGAIIQRTATELRFWLSSRSRPSDPMGCGRPNGTTPVNTYSLPGLGAHSHPSQNSGGLRKKRARREARNTSQDSDQDSDGSEQQRKRGCKPINGAPDRVLFACPFAKRYPDVYGQKPCAKTGWPTPHRTK